MAGIVWEVRNAGNDTNGGGFVAGSSGTDYSQQDNKNSGSNDKSTTDAVANGTTTITSATANFQTTIIGNIIYLAGGSGSLAGAWYFVSARGSSTSITVDRTVAAGTGITMNIGGALKTIGVFSLVSSAGDKCFVKADGTYTPTASIALSTNSTPPDQSPNVLVGYTTTRTDGGKVTVQATTNTGITIFNCTGTGWWIRNFILDCNNLGTSIGVTLGNYCNINNSVIKNFKTSGVKLGNTVTAVTNCEITGGASGATAAIDTNSQSTCNIFGNYIHDNVCPGINNSLASNGNSITFNVIANNSGASSDGIMIDYGEPIILNNSIYNNGRDGIRMRQQYIMSNVIKNNILVSNAGYGLNDPSTANPAMPNYDGNAYYNNTSGARHNMDDTTSSSTNTNGVSPYTNVLDVTLTGVPFSNAGAGDFSLNDTAGQGAACKAAGTPGAFLGSATTGYLDMGAVQHNAVLPLFVRAGNG